MTLAVYGAFAIATSVMVAIPITAVATVPIGYFVSSFFSLSKYKNDKAAIKKIFEEPAMGPPSQNEKIPRKTVKRKKRMIPDKLCYVRKKNNTLLPRCLAFLN